MLYTSRYLWFTTPMMEGPDIQALQEHLLRLRLLEKQPDGMFDTVTRDAIIQLQQSMQILADGVVGPEIWHYLESTAEQPAGLRAGGYSIRINRDTRTLTLFQNGSAVRSYPVAIGKPSTPTPLGSFGIIDKRINPGGPYGVRWMRFYAGYGIHGTNNPGSIGKAVSNGCVRMYNGDVTDLYNKVAVGTPVRVIGTASRSRYLMLGIRGGNDVMILQGALQQFGYYSGDIHGHYDEGTARAVTHFQHAQGLAADGIVGPETRNALRKQYAILNNDVEP